jgi:hypothetical protein
MYYLVSVDHISPEMTVEDPMQCLRLMMIRCGMTVKRMGMLGA